MKISDIPFLKHSLPLFYEPFPFDGKNLNPPLSPPLLKMLKTQKTHWNACTKILLYWRNILEMHGLTN